GQLAAGLAHEIGSPLQVLTSRARGLDAAADRPHAVRRLSAIVVGQTERITRIVQQLLAVARRRPPRFEILDLRPPMAAILDLLDFEARRRGVELRFEADRHLQSVRADPDQVQQMAFNLVRNALAASGAGDSITVELRRAVHTPPGST